MDVDLYEWLRAKESLFPMKISKMPSSWPIRDILLVSGPLPDHRKLAKFVSWTNFIKKGQLQEEGVRRFVEPTVLDWMPSSMLSLDS